MRRFELVFAENAQTQLLGQAALTVLLHFQPRTLHFPSELAERLSVEAIGEVLENAFGHRAATYIALRHKQNLELPALLLAAVVRLRIEV